MVAIRGLAQVIRRAGAFKRNPEPGIGCDNGLLVFRKVRINAHLLPAGAGHPDGVQHRRDNRFCIEAVEPLKAVLPDRLVGRPAYLCTLYRDEPFGTEDLAERDKELEHLLLCLALLTGKDLFIVFVEKHPFTTLPVRSLPRARAPSLHRPRSSRWCRPRAGTGRAMSPGPR